MTHAQNADSFTFRGLKMSPLSSVFFFLGYLLNAHAFAQQSWQTRGELPPTAVIWQKKVYICWWNSICIPMNETGDLEIRSLFLAVDQKLAAVMTTVPHASKAMRSQQMWSHKEDLCKFPPTLAAVSKMLQGWNFLHIFVVPQVM